MQNSSASSTASWPRARKESFMRDRGSNPHIGTANISEADGTTATAHGDIAVDANPYQIRIVHAAPDGFILAKFEAKAAEVNRAVRFVRKMRQHSYAACLIGIRHDCWPNGLHAALVQEFGPVNWLSPQVLAQSAPQLRNAMQVLKFLRATYMAVCAGSAGHEASKPWERWQRIVSNELAISLQTDTTDDVPF
jgi:hypothetical protein